MQGLQMAKNLRKKLPPADTVRVFDVNPASMDAFAADAKDAPPGGAAVEISGSALEAVRDAVSALAISRSTQTTGPEALTPSPANSPSPTHLSVSYANTPRTQS